MTSHGAQWAALAREYLAIRKEEVLEAAVAAAPDAMIASFLRAFGADDLPKILASVGNLANRLEHSGSREGSRTVTLLLADLIAGLVEKFAGFPVEEQDQALQTGIASCRKAVGLAAELGDLGCTACFTALLGRGLHEARELEGARRALEEAVEVYGRLATNRPLLYGRQLAGALTNLGNVLRDLRQLEGARRTHTRALEVRRRLAAEQPQLYAPEVAGTLTNLAAVLFDLREMDAARLALEEGLAVYRWLVRERPKVYEPHLAATLNNLGAALRDLRELAGARKAYAEALEVRRRLAAGRPQVYTPDVAGTLNNLATVLLDLRELGGARRALEEGLQLYRRLADERPQIYKPYEATTLHNLGNVLLNLRDLDGARRAFEEALEVRRRLAVEQPHVYEPYVADTLNNLGTVLCDSQEWKGARRAYEEALEVRRRLAVEQPHVHEPCAVAVLNNLGIVLHDLMEPVEARRAYSEALTLCDRHALWLESADTHANLSFLEEKGGDADASLRESEAAVASCERGLGQLAEKEHRDVFKGRMESQYRRLIGHYAANGQKGAVRPELIRLLESLRRVEALAGFGVGIGTEPTDSEREFEELAAGNGALADRLRGAQAAFLWMHHTSAGTVFVMLAAGSCRVEVADLVVMEKLGELFGEVESRIAAFPGRNPDLTAGIDLTRSALATGLDEKGKAAFAALPEGVRHLLGGDEWGTVFVAPCSHTMNVPLEMLMANGSWLGLRKLLVRVPSLADVRGLLDRQPSGRTAVVVGNALHNGSHPLPGADAMATALSDVLRQRGFAGDPLMNGQATTVAVLAALAEPGPALWAQMGHGRRPEKEEGTEYLALAGGDKLLPEHIARLRWRTHPLVHHDCCVAGTTRGRGGGRFDGHPVAALLAGASAVLSSVHPLWDDTAAEFSMCLYGKLLDRSRPQPLGAALLAARLEVAAAHYDNPLVWATTVLWGNPWATLPVPAM